VTRAYGRTPANVPSSHGQNPAMKAHLLTVTPLFLAAVVTAQDPAKPGAPEPVKASPPAAEVIKEPTVQDRIKALESEIAKRKLELEQIRQVESQGGMAPRVKAFLDERQITAKSIEAKNRPGVQPAAPTAPKKSGARLLGDAEKAALPKDVIFTVDGAPVTKAEFDTAFDYLESYPRQESDAQLKEHAMLELVQLKAVQVEFAEAREAARQRIMATAKRLADDPSLDFAEVARESSDCPSKAQGGDLNYFGRVGMDFNFSRVAFTEEVGEVSDPVESVFGFHIIKVTGREKGDTPANDRVRASHILAQYTPDRAALGKVMQRVQSGQVDLAFADADYRQYAPAAFR